MPLNTALLAVQNLEGEHVFKAVPEDQAEMVHGLMRSLTTMEKVIPVIQHRLTTGPQ